MKLYFYDGALDVAATTTADLALLVPAYLDQSQADNLEVISRVTAKIRELTHGDTGEPLELYFCSDAAATASSWAADSATTLAVGLGTPDPRTADTYASTTSFTISGNARLGTLSLATNALRDALLDQMAARRGGIGVFTLHVRKTTGGITTTVARLPIRVDPGVLGATPLDPTTTSYVTSAQFQAGTILNLASITSLTGGGATTLDGLEAGGTSYPVGCVVLLSYSDVQQLWKLKGTYIAADDVDDGKVKPDNSDSTLNPCHWQQL